MLSEWFLPRALLSQLFMSQPRFWHLLRKRGAESCRTTLRTIEVQKLMDPSHTEPGGARQFEPRCRLSILHLPSTFLPSLLSCSVFPESIHSSPPASSPSLSLSFSLPLPLVPTRTPPNSSIVFHRYTCSVHVHTYTSREESRDPGQKQ